MSNNPPWVTAKLRAWLPAQDCLLCGANSGQALVCEACAADLPALPAAQCPTCALPTPSGQTCGECLRRPPHFDATVARWRYGFPLDRLVQALKYAHRLAAAEFLARGMLAGNIPTGDCLLPVPLSAAHLRQRGFNQAMELARSLAQATGLPLLTEAVERTADTAPQASLPWKARRKNIRNAFEGRQDLSGRHVIVIDDVMTTGATLDELARTLKKHGAARVTNWVVARTLKD